MVDDPEPAAHLPPGRRPLIAQFIRSPKKVFMTGFITSIIIGLLSFQLFHGYFIPIFMALFAYSNYREYRNAPF